MENDVFQRYSAYYDLLYRDKDYSAEAAYIADAVRLASPQAQSILEFGSGTGRHGRLLARQGFDVCGIERSKSMMAFASVAATGDESAAPGNFDCLCGDINSIRLDQTFDAVVALFHVVSYQTSNDDVLSTLNSAMHHLRPGGIFVFDVWHGPAVLSQRPSVRIKRVEGQHARLIRLAEPELQIEAGVVIVRYTMLVESRDDGKLTTFTEEHRMRYFFPTEIDLLARHTGFNVETSEEFLTRAMPSAKTWGVTYVLRKAN